METRVTRLEEDMRDVKSAIGRLEATTLEIKVMLAATLPHLATKAEVADLKGDLTAALADKPGKTCMWGVLAVLLTAYACGLAALAVLK
jgi:hypothetical protein